MVRTSLYHYLELLYALPFVRSNYPPVSLHHLIVLWWCRNIYLLSIAYGSRPQLSPRLTLSGRTFPRNP